MSPRYQDQWTNVPALGVSMHARVWRTWAGNGASNPILVLVPGLGMSSRYWTRVAKRLAGAFTVLCPDLPGFGRSQRPRGVRWPGGPGATQQADQLLAWLDAVGIHRAIFCGHSTGCQTVIDLARRHPHRAQRLVLIAPTFEPRRRTLWRSFPRLLLAAWFELPSLLALLTVDYLSAGPARVLQQALRMMDDPLERKLPEIAAPTLIIAARLDALVSVQWARRMAHLLPAGRLVVVERAGHALQHSAPSITAGLIAQFAAGDAMVGDADARETIVAPAENPQRDPLALPQPITPQMHVLLDAAIAAACVALPATAECGPRTRRILSTAALVAIGGSVGSMPPTAPRRRLPMIVHANLDLACGLALLAGSATSLRREPRAARAAVAAIGIAQLAGALLTAKPTGPAVANRRGSSARR
jgi:pimeloyl-ACP methyl ester carboxylesterase